MSMEKIRILVVDDEEPICEVLKFNLEREGYEVDTCTSAEQALTLDLREYSLIMLDIMMGEMSGLGMARILRHRDSKRPRYRGGRLYTEAFFAERGAGKGEERAETFHEQFLQERGCGGAYRNRTFRP